MEIDEIKRLSPAEQEKKLAELKWQNYINMAKWCKNSSNFPMGKMEELRALQKVTGVKK